MYFPIKIKYTKIFLVISFSLVLMNTALSQQLTRHKAIAAFMFNFAKNIKWENEDKINEFHILIIGEDENVVRELSKLAKTKTLRNKPIVIASSKKYSDTAQAQMIFVMKDKEDELENVYKKIAGKNILLVSDRYKDNKIIMVNFFDTEDHKLLFEINKTNIEKQNLFIMPDMVLLGGKDVDIINLYKKSQDTLQLIKDNITVLKSQIDQYEQQVISYKLQIENSYKEIAKQELLIDQQTLIFETQVNEISKQHSEILELQNNKKNQLITLAKQKELLAESETKLQDKKLEIDKGNAILLDQHKKTDSLAIAIKEKTNILEKQNITISNQKKISYLLIAIIVLALGLAYAIFRGYKSYKKAHRKISRQKIQLEKTLGELQATEAELILTNATKDKFFSIIAHDLRNPFSGIIGSTSMLLRKLEKKTLTDEEAFSFASMAGDSAKRGHALLENLLEWSLSQTGRITNNPSDLNLHEIVNKCIEITATQANAKNIQIVNDVPGDFNLKADEHLLSTILRNLTTNAIKYTPDSGTVTIRSKKNPDNTEISVTDTGIGIPEDIASKLFRIETNVSKPGTADEKGTGLGLVLCREFVEKQGGKIWVVSQPEKGSTFIFTVPG